jgi:hypothetical protein
MAETKIVLQVGSTVRLTKTGDIVIDNPEIELSREQNAADAVLSYTFDPQTYASPRARFRSSIEIFH